MKWGKKINVPLEHRGFCASYRGGYNDAVSFHQKLPRRVFTCDEAYASYEAGYAVGKSANRKGPTMRPEGVGEV